MLKLLWLLIPGCLLAQQQQTLTDARIVDLVQAGVSESEVLRIVASAPKFTFDLQPGSTQDMMQAGVSENIIKAMAARESGAAAVLSSPPAARSVPAAASASPTVPAQAAPMSATAAPVSEVGVYVLQGGSWVEMMPEVVNWKTGGVLKSVSTAFIVKGDVNGRIRGGSSKVRLSNPVQLLVYCREGTQVTEYQLIHLRAHPNAREFRTLTGGILHVSGGSNRDDLPFDSQRIAPRMWTIPLTGLKPGEYGLLPPGASESGSASAQLGKMYTFTVQE